jgi:hypothetical protein
VQEHDRLARRIAAFLPVDLVAIADGKVALPRRLDGGIEAAARGDVNARTPLP